MFGLDFDRRAGKEFDAMIVAGATGFRGDRDRGILNLVEPSERLLGKHVRRQISERIGLVIIASIASRSAHNRSPCFLASPFCSW